MSRRSRPAVLGGALVLCGLAAPADAQQYNEDDSLPWPATLHPGSTNERVELGDPFGDGREHAFVLRNGRLCVAFEPRHFEWISEPGNSPTAVVDFTLVEAPGSGATPTRDYVYFTTSQGLYVTRLQEASWSYLAPTLVAQGAWAGATQLRSHDIDGANREDLVAVSGAGTQVLAMLLGPTGAPTVSSATTPTGTPLDVAVGNFDSDGAVEIATLTTSSIQFYDANPSTLVLTLILGWPNPSGGGLMTRFRDGGGGGRDRVAVALEWPTAGEWILQTMDAVARDNPIPLEGTPPGGTEDWLPPTGLVAVDLVGDSPGLGSDVLVVHDLWPEPAVYENQATTVGAQQLDADEVVSWPVVDDPGSPWATGLTIPPGVADGASLLGEQTGVFSVQAATPATDQLYVVPNFSDPTGSALNLSFVDGVGYTHANVVDGPCSFRFRVNLPEDAIEAGYDHLQVIVWVLDIGNETLPTVVMNEVLPPGSGTLDGNGELLVEQGEFDLGFDFTGLDPAVLAWTNGEHFAANYRWVKVDPNWTGVAGDDIDLDGVSREYLGGFAIRSNQSAVDWTGIQNNLNWLFNNMPSGPQNEILLDVPGQGSLVGAYLGAPRLPDLGLPAPPPEPKLAYYPYEPIPLPR